MQTADRLKSLELGPAEAGRGTHMNPQVQTLNRMFVGGRERVDTHAGILVGRWALEESQAL